MNVPPWVSELADEFAGAAGADPEFPRKLRRAVTRALPMALIDLPRLCLFDVRDWLVREKLGYPCDLPDRPLRACLLAYRDWGYVFLDGTDPEDEQRFSLAHEAAHFLRHYRQPRREAARRLGAQALEVLDGRRPPTAEEVIRAALVGVPVGPHLHLMRRADDGGLSTETAIAEEEADRLAYELLAPAEEVIGRGRTGADPVAMLREIFGLPAAPAMRYARLLFGARESEPLLRRLGLA